MMKTFRLSNFILNEKYNGAGHAVAASVNGVIIDIVYIRDALPDFDSETQSLQSVIKDGRVQATIRELQAKGQVHIGMCSCSEFIEL